MGATDVAVGDVEGVVVESGVDDVGGTEVVLDTVVLEVVSTVVVVGLEVVVVSSGSVVVVSDSVVEVVDMRHFITHE